ncbi:MAG: hypothetical protein QN166_07140 [Armatimonadota bacterium]|nr:hypothetical protein [Armatimonadota bacterium]MDR7542197.1 hypothetical protein [Armatimonadota bacterium]
MSFTVTDFQDLLRLLRERPEWREELRRLLLTEELFALPQGVRELATEVRRLAELQARTHEQISQLVQAQVRAEEQARRLEQALAELAQAQRRTEERVGRLEQALAELAQAQRRTEERVGHLEQALAELAQAQRRTEERVGHLEGAVERLAEAQARTEQVVQQLAQQVGRLSDAVGFTLEELARELAPAYLAERYGIRVAALERRFFTVDGEEVEVDFFGEGTRDGEPVVVLGEARSRIYGRDVETLARRARALGPQLLGTPVPVLFGFVVHPSAVEAAARTGVLVVAAVR